MRPKEKASLHHSCFQLVRLNGHLIRLPVGGAKLMKLDCVDEMSIKLAVHAAIVCE